MTRLKSQLLYETTEFMKAKFHKLTPVCILKNTLCSNFLNTDISEQQKESNPTLKTHLENLKFWKEVDWKSESGQNIDLKTLVESYISTAAVDLKLKESKVVASAFQTKTCCHNTFQMLSMNRHKVK